MIKRLVATGVVLGAVALTAGSISSATGQGGGGHHGNHGDKVRVLSTNTEEGFVDVGDPDFSLGDQFIFTSELTKRGKLVGHTGVVCTVTSLEREESQCVGTASFHKGQITIQGCSPANLWSSSSRSRAARAPLRRRRHPGGQGAVRYPGAADVLPGLTVSRTFGASGRDRTRDQPIEVGTPPLNYRHSHPNVAPSTPGGWLRWGTRTRTQILRCRPRCAGRGHRSGSR